MNDPRLNPGTEGDAADPRLPDELVAALRREDSRGTLAVPPERDEQVLAACRAELGQRLAEQGKGGFPATSARDRATGMSPFQDSSRPLPETATRIIPFPRMWLRWVAAAAAMITLLFCLVIALRPRPDASGIEINLAQPTILDAFALARALESSSLGGARHGDLNGDGHMDQGDVNWLAQRAVRLPEGGAL